MSLNTREKPKKDKKKVKEPEEPIPDSLQNAPEPAQKEELEPPRPISLQEEKGDVPRPTRLPPRFKERFKPHKTQEEQPTTDETAIQKPATIKAEKTESTKNIKIKPPVSIRQRRESIPSPTASKEKPQQRVQPTRIQLEEEQTVRPAETTQKTGRTLSDLVKPEEDPLLKQFNCDEIIQRPKEQSWPWKTSVTVKIPPEMEAYWKIEASLYSAISMLHFFSIAYEKGDIAQEVYSKQLKSQLLEAIQLRFKLEKDDKFNWEKFVQENHLMELFAEGVEKLARVTGSSDIDAALDE